MTNNFDKFISFNFQVSNNQRFEKCPDTFEGRVLLQELFQPTFQWCIASRTSYELDGALNSSVFLWGGLKKTRIFPNTILENIVNSILLPILSLSQEIKNCNFW